MFWQETNEIPIQPVQWGRMQIAVRTPVLSPHFAMVALFVLVIGAAGLVRAADAPAGVGKNDVARVFRFHAAAQAEALRDAVERASFDEALREALRQLVGQYLRLVDEEVERIAKPPGSVEQAIAEADELARQFNDEKIAAWLDAHAAAYQPVQEQIALAEAYGRAAAEEPDAIVRAARAAGLPPEREAELRKTVTATHDRLKHANEAAMKRLRQAEDKAAAAESSAPTAAKPQAPGTGGGPAPAPPPAPAPSSEEQTLQLLEHLTWADEHTRGVAAANELRAVVDKLLPDPAQRKVAADEMLRWYQNHAPSEDGGRDSGPPAQVPQKGAAKESTPAPNPGF